MKSIIIAGVARAGKTTVCKRLRKYGFNHITCDSLFYTFEQIFPWLGINQEETTQGVKNASRKFCPFLTTLIKAIEEENLGYPTVFDIYQLMPEDYIKYMKKENIKVYFLGYPDISEEEEFKILRANKVPEEYTQKYDDEYLKKLIKQRIEESKFIQKECEKYNLPFINTSKDRNENINELIEEILKDIKGSIMEDKNII